MPSYRRCLAVAAVLATFAVVLAALPGTALPNPHSQRTAQVLQVITDDLDNSFHSDGWTRVNAGDNGIDQAYAVAIDSNNKIIVAGTSGNDFAVVRYTTAGTLDTTFSTDGKLTTDIGSSTDDTAYAVAIDSNNKIIVAGTSGNDFAVVRYTTAGALDTTFSTDGKLTTDIGSSTDDTAYAVAIDSNNKIIVAGTNGADFAVVRYTTAGALDTTFDTDGKLTTDIGSSTDDTAYAVAIDSNNKIIVAGTNGADFAVVRYTTAGALDTTFDTDGKLTTDFGSGSEHASGVAIHSDGKIAVGGGDGSKLLLARYTSAGALDTTFDTDGKVTRDGAPTVAGVAFQSDGKILVASSKGNAFQMDRFTTSGSVDEDGYYPGDVRPSLNVAALPEHRHDGDVYSRTVARGLAINSYGRSFVAGTARGDFAVASWTTRGGPNGDLRQSGGSAGMLHTNIARNAPDVGNAVAIDANGKIVIAGSFASEEGERILLTRLNSNGTVDTTFATNGFSLPQTQDDNISHVQRALDLTIIADGSILVSGTSEGRKFVLMKYSSDGTLDSSFFSRNGGYRVVAPRGHNTLGDQGFGELWGAYAVAEDVEGRIVLAGPEPGATDPSQDGADDGIILFRLNAGGGLDFDDFGTKARVETDITDGDDAVYAIAIQPDGEIVVAGRGNADGDDDFAVVRYTTAGALDTTFSTDGHLTTDIGSSTEDTAYAVAIDADGKIIAAGTSGDDFAVVRYTTAGALDTTFSTDGKLTTDIASSSKDAAHEVFVQTDGKIVVAGVSDDKFAVVRYTAGGDLDTSFGSDGKMVFDVGGARSMRGAAVDSSGNVVMVGGSQKPRDILVARASLGLSILAPTTAPGMPTSVQATVSGTSAIVSWTAPANDGGSDITSYTATSDPDGETCTTTDGTTTTCTITGLTSGQDYTFTVTATNSAGTSTQSSASTEVTIPANVPDAPTSVTATVSGTSATVSWTAPANDGGADITRYTATSNPHSRTCTTTDGTTTTCTITGLTRGQAYTFTVTATNTSGTSTQSTASASVTIPTTAPDAPTSVTATVSGTSATVSWTAPANDGGSDITSYTATSDPGGETCTTTDTTNCTITGLTIGQAYTFTVTATNNDGTSPASSPSASVTILAVAPDAPTSVQATVSGTSATVSWTAPANDGGADITSYTATSNPHSRTCTTTDTTSCTITGLTRGQAYTFTVTATNSAGTSAQSTASTEVTISAVAPDAPTSVQATVSGTSATVSWTAPANDGGADITSYTATSDPDGDTCTTTDGTTTTCTITGLTRGQAYTFTVTATNNAGTSAQSSASTEVTIPANAPGAPTSVTATVSGTSATVSWTAPANNGGSDITSYTATSNPHSRTCTTTDGTTTTCTITGLTRGQAYTFTVTATNSSGTSAQSTASASVTIPAVAPDAPTSVTATVSGTSATVSWTAPANNGGADITRYTATSDPGGETCTTTDGTTTTCTITGLTRGQAYTFTVTATNNEGTSPASSPSASVTIPAVAPDAPTSVTATVSGTSATVSWTAPANDGGSDITSYTATSDPDGETCTTTDGTTTTCTITGVTRGQAYTFTVTATNTAGTSAQSTASASVTIPAVAPDAPTSVTATVSGTSATVSWTAPANNGGADITRYTATSDPGGAEPAPQPTAPPPPAPSPDSPAARPTPSPSPPPTPQEPPPSRRPRHQ